MDNINKAIEDIKNFIEGNRIELVECYNILEHLEKYKKQNELIQELKEKLIQILDTYSDNAYKKDEEYFEYQAQLAILNKLLESE